MRISSHPTTSAAPPMTSDGDGELGRGGVLAGEGEHGHEQQPDDGIAEPRPHAIRVRAPTPGITTRPGLM